jgi:hypothetical protein
MSGFVLPVLPKRVVDFTTLVTGTEDLILADRVPLLHWRELTLRMQISDHSLSGGSGTIKIIVIPQSWTAEDPGVQFLSTSTTIAATLGSTTPNPAFLSAPLTTIGGGAVIAAMARIVAQGNRLAAGAINATLSMAFSTKDA